MVLSLILQLAAFTEPFPLNQHVTQTDMQEIEFERILYLDAKSLKIDKLEGELEFACPTGFQGI